MLGGVGGDLVQHLRHGREPGQIALQQGQSPLGQVDVGVVQPGQHHLSPQVDHARAGARQASAPASLPTKTILPSCTATAVTRLRLASMVKTAPFLRMRSAV